MNCAEWEEKLNAELDGELPGDDRAPLDAHLASCADCRGSREALHAQGRELAALRIDSAALEARIITAVRAERPSRGGFRIWIGAAAAAALLAISAVLFRPTETPPSRPWMVLELATGPIEERIGERWVPLPPGSGVRPGMQVRTGDASKCEISCLDGSVLRLNTATEIQVQDPRTIQLREGELFAKVAGAPQPFRFTTPDGGLTADESVLDLSRRPAARSSALEPPRLVTTLALLQGKATIAEQEIQTQTSCVMGGTSAVRPLPLDPLLQSRWIHDLLKLKDKDDPEVAGRVTALLAKLGRTKTTGLYEREIRAFGERSVPALLALVTKLPDDLSAYDRRNAARLLMDLAGPREVEALVKLLRDRDDDVRAAAHGALTRITGVNLRGPEAWEAWLQENRDVWR